MFSLGKSHVKSIMVSIKLLNFHKSVNLGFLIGTSLENRPCIDYSRAFLLN